MEQIHKHLYPDSFHVSEVPLLENQKPFIAHGERQTPPKDGSFHLKMSISSYFFSLDLQDLPLTLPLTARALVQHIKLVEKK